MAVIYLRSSSGVDTNDGLTWATAKATLASALTAAGAGGTVYVRDDHAEVGTTVMNVSSPGTAAAPVSIVCVSGSSEPPTTASTGAVVSTSDAMYFLGFAAAYGVDFRAGVGSGTTAKGMYWYSTASWAWVYKDCKIGIYSTGANSRFFFGANNSGVDDQKIVLVNTPLYFGGAYTQAIDLRCRFEWYDSVGLAAGSSAPPTFIMASASGLPADAVIDGVDLSAIGTGKYLVAASGIIASRITFQNCRLGIDPSVAVTGTTVSPGGTLVSFYNCDDENTNWRLVKYDWGGILSADNTVYRAGGASDGTTSFSWKMASNASVSEAFPFYSEEIVTWNETTGAAKTITCEVTHSEASDLTDAEVWIEVEVLGTSGYPVSEWYTTQRGAGLSEANPLMTAMTIPTSTVSWTGAGSRKQVITAAVTPQLKGPIRARVVLAKPSATVWADPNFTVS